MTPPLSTSSVLTGYVESRVSLPSPSPFLTSSLLNRQYPKITSGFDFANGGAQMQEFHDKYCTSDGIKFAIGEIGLGVSATIAQRLAWLENIMESASTMEHMISVSWFNVRPFLRNKRQKKTHFFRPTVLQGRLQLQGCCR